mmetsp:Transcript_12634/g.38667  ORF Transcript_12634/g.38667 Transcript_12634/m.38667 type:complete len:147 (-) Transcript_12634:178-618(-)|eukprot:CAMPEP_0198723398 /NCGR_PEP_ID=MMETSP1475-20131203/898_1 /TAXON_ID= ORGANISM="Unidentified sp., Strain CCMP1999" /NCGR_SAMPLE_ID=MMETSP1475 /ASSEMBLY_ACC=CAM_ASM_001111 /LENGTH=146 /DNA_ID=CAMNT_0044484509 /DNA_START=100 /DNA_END=540 /DNA_ORIENTATION=+
MAFVGVSGALTGKRTSRATCVRMSADAQPNRRDFLKAVAAIAVTLGVPSSVLAEREYDGVAYLGGSEQIDVNNANIRVFQKYPGLYPNIGRLVVKYGPYKDVSQVFEIPELTSQQKETLKKYQDKLVALEPKPEYEIDKVNNGLYR